MAAYHSAKTDALPSDAAMFSQPPMLSVVGEKFLPARCRPRTLSYCPTMDLVAVVTVLDLPGDEGSTEEKLSIWRLNGQQVFGWDAPKGLEIPFVRWKEDGRLIALGTSDGVIRLLNVMSGGKVVHCLNPSSGHDATTPGFSFLSWAVNFGDGKGVRALLAEEGTGFGLDDLLTLGAGKDALGKIKADLPRELACGIDVETSVPQLSLLPPGTGAGRGWGFGGSGGDDDVFSTRASLDAIFHAPNSTSGPPRLHDEVDVLLTGFDDGSIYIRIFDCFDIGTVDVSASLPKGSRMTRVVQHLAHPLHSAHVLIVRTSTTQNDDPLHVVALDLNFIPQSSPYYLPTLATKSTQLLNLLRYLTQVSIHLSIELRGAFELPNKFIRNIDDTLGQRPEGATNFFSAAYQLVVTGECSDELRDWMVDELGERNVKRWEKASSLGMENVRRLVHECLLPALERCLIVLSRLEGLSKFAKSAEALGLNAQSLKQVRDTMDCLVLLAHYLLKAVGKEIKQCAAFMKWLRLEVEIQGLEKENAGGPGSERLEETCMRRDELEVRTVLDYIKEVMGKSGMAAFIRPSVDARGSSLVGPSYDWSQNQVHVGFYDVFKQMLRVQMGQGKRPDLDDLLRRLTGQAEKVFDGIARTLRKSVMHSRIFTLQSDCSAEGITARMLLRPESGYELVVATKNEAAAGRLFLHHIPWGAATRTKTPEVRDYSTPGNEEIADMKFIDDTDLMVLCSGQDKAHLHTLNYSSCEPDWQERHTFDLSSVGKAPSELEVNGRQGRRAACVLEADMKLTVFDLDSGQADEQILPEDEDVTMG